MEAPRVVLLAPRDEATLRLLVALDDLSFREGLRYGEAEFRRRLAAPGALVLAPESGGVPVAVALCERRRDDLFLDVLAVHPDARGRGVGRLLVDAVVARARGAGCAAVRVHAERRDQAGVDLVRFYGKAGFEVEEDHGDWIAFRLSLRGHGGAAPPRG